MQFPVVIVGAGPTGITAATLLGQRGVRCLVIDRWSGVYAQPRAVHLDDEVYRIIDRLGAGAEFARISRPTGGLRLLSPGHRVLAEFARAGIAPKSGFPRANMFDQPELEAVLRSNLSKVPAVSLRESARVIGVRRHREGALVTIEDLESGQTYEVAAEFVLGCDGANSTVRGTIDSTLEDLNFEQRWLVVDVDTDRELGQWEGVHQLCGSQRAGTYMRVGERRYRWEFQLLEGETVQDFRNIAALAPLIAPWTGDIPQGDLSVVRIAEYTFRAKIADRWRDGPVFLLGDAAHLTPPFIGQGMGAGIRDAHNLAWKIAGVIDGSLPESVLQSYEIERKPHALSVIKLAKLTGQVMTSGGRLGDAVRWIVAPLLQVIPTVRARVLDSETKPLTRNRWTGVDRRDRLAGTLCPNLEIDGERLDQIGRFSFCLLSEGAIDPESAGRMQARGVLMVEAQPGDPLWLWLRESQVASVLVRPDGTVFASGDTRSVVANFESLFGS